MEEYCYVMVKPGFANNSKLVEDVINELTNIGLELVICQRVKYDSQSAEQHYIAKAQKPFYNELVSYISSDYSLGIVLKGENAIALARQKVEELRNSLKDKYNLKTDLTKNILHCTAKTNVKGQLVDIDSRREIELFSKLCKNIIKG